MTHNTPLPRGSASAFIVQTIIDAGTKQITFYEARATHLTFTPISGSSGILYSIQDRSPEGSVLDSSLFRHIYMTVLSVAGRLPILGDRDAAGRDFGHLHLARSKNLFVFREGGMLEAATFVPGHGVVLRHVRGVFSADDILESARVLMDIERDMGDAACM